MVFKKLMRAFGVGGPSVDTVLTNPNTRPGLSLDGEVNITGGDHLVNIEYVALGLVTRVEAETAGGGEYEGLVEFARLDVAGAFSLEPGAQRSIPFTFPIPWETPITDIYGQRLRGMVMGLRTELAVAKAVDKGDLDLVQVHALPAQERILDAFAKIGFRFKNADLERGHIAGVHQTLPFYQEIEFYPAGAYAQRINEVEVTFVTSPTHVDVFMEFDKRGGFLRPGPDTYGHFRVAHEEARTTDWTAVVEGWVRQASKRYSSLRGDPGYGHGHGYPPQKSHGYGHRGMGGAGAVAAGVAGGLIGGMILGEAMDGMMDGDDLGDFGE